MPVENIVDAERQPELKVSLLQGTLNAFKCPKCGNAGVLATPLLYHDGSKQLFLALTPANMNAKAADSQKMIGSMTNMLMNSLPPEKRKAYLFQPKMFLTMESMVQAILEADGITKEMIEAQKAKANLFEDLLEQVDNDEQFKQLVTKNEALIDEEFFDMLTQPRRRGPEPGGRAKHQRSVAAAPETAADYQGRAGSLWNRRGS